MSIIREVRRKLGALRDEALYGAETRRVAAEAARMRAEWIDAAARVLTPMPSVSLPGPVPVEVHCTAGEAHSGMGLWAGWSLMRFLPGARFVLHDDGTLTPATRAVWERVLPGLRILGVAEGQEATQALLEDPAPRVLDWTRHYHFGNKLGAVQALTRAPRLIEMDSDVLILQRPDDLLAALDDPALSMLWNRDERYAYAYPEALLREVLGPLFPGPLPDRLNGGLTLIRPFDAEEWRFLDAVLLALEADPRTDPHRYWMQQTLHALVAARRGAGARPLSRGYDIYNGPMRPGSVARHFVGNPRTRPRFFTEGVPALIRSARAAGHLPADFAADHAPMRP